MKIRILFEADYQVVAVMVNASCPAQDFLTEGEASTRAAREGLLTMLEYVAAKGLHGVPSKWFHEADKQEGIYEFIKGPLRLFFFKGVNGQIAVCTSGVRKTTSKADKSLVGKAIEMRKAYFHAVADNTLEVAKDENQ